MHCLLSLHSNYPPLSHSRAVTTSLSALVSLHVPGQTPTVFTLIVAVLLNPLCIVCARARRGRCSKKIGAQFEIRGYIRLSARLPCAVRWNRVSRVRKYGQKVHYAGYAVIVPPCAFFFAPAWPRTCLWFFSSFFFSFFGSCQIVKSLSRENGTGRTVGYLGRVLQTGA